MSGFSIWGHDVGGYQNTNFSPVSPADLFIRWTQFGCFSPIMQMHRQVDGENLRQYPWGYPEAGETTDNNRALANYQFYATLHSRLFPYLYTYAKQSSETGVPILRPLVLIHQDDPRTFHRPAHVLLRRRPARRPGDRSRRRPTARSTSRRGTGSTSGRTSVTPASRISPGRIPPSLTRHNPKSPCSCEAGRSCR